MDDSSLISAFLDGDREAVFQFTRWIGLEIRTHGHGDAQRQREDLIQECLLRTWNALGRSEFRGQSGLQRYVRAITRHVIVDHLRRNPRREVTESEAATTGTTAPGAEERLVAEDLVTRVLAGLPEEDGRLLVEAYVDERSYQQMADARGISHGTLKVRVFRAARRAREIWQRLRPLRGTVGVETNLAESES